MTRLPCLAIVLICVAGCPQPIDDAPVDLDGDGSPAGEDCDDSDASALPGAAESCDGIDNDCDGDVDEADADDAGTWYADEDGDGFGDGDAAVVACDQPEGYVALDGDCDDSDALVHPDADELCNDADDDCDGAVDDGLPLDDWYPDGDGDGFGDADAAPIEDCQQPKGAVADDTDCDDADPAIHPEAAEVCDGIDNDCEGGADDGLTFQDWYPDVDGDGFGEAGAAPTSDCAQPVGHVLDDTDCDDGDDTIHPDAAEACNGLDDDCNTLIDDGLTFQDYYPDADGDGFGDPDGAAVNACTEPPGMVRDATDCDDGDPAINPGATEQCNGLDDECDGVADSSDELVNGDAELGTLDGWTASDATLILAHQSSSQSAGTVTPWEGSWHFAWTGHPDSYGTLTQQGPVIVPGGVMALSGAQQSEFGDAGQATLTYLDELGTVLDQVSSGSLTTDNLTWETFEISLAAPAGAVTWEVLLEGTLVYGSYINVFFDDLQLACVP